MADYVLKPAERERLQLTVERLKKRLAQRASPEGAAPPGGAPLQQLLHRLATGMGNAPTLPALDPGHRRPTIQMIPVEEVLFFISDEKYTRVQTRAARGADPQADQGAGRRARSAARSGRSTGPRW